MKNWKREHDLGVLVQSLGSNLTGYLEYSPDESIKAGIEGCKELYQSCSECNKETPILVPSIEKKEWFRESMRQAMVGCPSSISSAFKHFWFHARCSECGADVLLMRS